MRISRKKFGTFFKIFVSRPTTLVAVIGGFPSDLSITRKTDGNFVSRPILIY